MKHFLLIALVATIILGIPSFAKEDAKKPSFSPEVQKIVKAIRKNIWGDKKAMYMEQTIKATIPFAGEQIMKTRAWTMAPNKSRFEIYEPADMGSTSISNGEEIIYINKEGKVHRPDNRERAQKGYQMDFTNFFEEFDVSLYQGLRAGTYLLRCVPLKESIFGDSMKYIDMVVDSKSHLLTGQTMYPKDLPFIMESTMTYGKNNVPDKMNFVMKMEGMEEDSEDNPFGSFMKSMGETKFEITTTKFVRADSFPDSYFTLAK